MAGPEPGADGAPRPLAAALTADHLALSVADLDATVAWYAATLGFRPVVVAAFPRTVCRGARFAFLHLDGLMIELIEEEGSRARPLAGRPMEEQASVQGANHLGFVVRDLDATVAELEGRGVVFTTGATPIPAFRTRFAQCADNEGNLIELVERSIPDTPSMRHNGQ